MSYLPLWLSVYLRTFLTSQATLLRPEALPLDGSADLLMTASFLSVYEFEYYLISVVTSDGIVSMQFNSSIRVVHSSNNPGLIKHGITSTEFQCAIR